MIPGCTGWGCKTMCELANGCKKRRPSAGVSHYSRSTSCLCSQHHLPTQCILQARCVQSDITYCLSTSSTCPPSPRPIKKLQLFLSLLHVSPLLPRLTVTHTLTHSWGLFQRESNIHSLRFFLVVSAPIWDFRLSAVPRLILPPSTHYLFYFSHFIHSITYYFFYPLYICIFIFC